MNEDVFVKFIVQSAKRHPRVIDLNRGKTLAFKRQCPLYEFFFLTVLIQQSAKTQTNSVDQSLQLCIAQTN